MNEQAGLSLATSGSDNPNPILHGRMGQAERAFSAASTFLSGIMAISASQFIGAPLKLVDPKAYDAYMAKTKESFAVLMTTITQWWSPTIVRVSGDESMKGQLFQMEDGSLKCNFPHRLVLMANHQLYTDWLYLWWIAYTNKMHGRIYIILKESLKQLPIFGWGAQFYNFIFLSRKWETDRYRFRSALNTLKNPEDPMWLLIFPEGTNLSGVTREKSESWAKKSGVPDMKHQLLPRSTGLQFCLQELQTTTNWLYDCTIAYEGVPKGLYGQDIYTLRSSFFEGRPPKSVNMFWRRFRISDIPLGNNEAFSRWLNNRWREKDYILEYFYKFGQFPAEDASKALAAATGKRKPKHAKAIGTEVKAGGWDEFLGIFGPVTSAAGALSNVDLTEPAKFEALFGQLAQHPQLNMTNLQRTPIAVAGQKAVSDAFLAAQNSQIIPPAILKFLVEESPLTPEQMQQAMLHSAKHFGNAQMQKILAPDAALQAQKNETTSNTGVMQSSSASVGRARATAARRVTQAAPMANKAALITRPLTTIAVQKAATSLQGAAAQRARAQNAAMPVQAPVVKGSIAEKAPVTASRSPALASAPTAKHTLAKKGVTRTAGATNISEAPITIKAGR